MAFESSLSYRQVFLRRVRFASPIKLKHAAIPLAFLLVCLYRNQNIGELSTVEALLGLLIVGLSFTPLIIWVSKEKREPPAFQCFCLIFFPYYAYPILACKPAYIRFPEATRVTADLSVVVFLATAIVFYYLVRSSHFLAPGMQFLARRRMRPAVENSVFTVFLTIWSALMLARFFGYLRLGSLQHLVFSVASNCGTIAVWTLARKLGQGKMSLIHALFFITVTFATVFFASATGTLAYGFMICVLGIVAFTLGSRRIPWFAILLVLTAFSFLNLGKGAMRAIYWRHGSPLLTVEKTIDIYRVWSWASWDGLLNLDRPDMKERGVLDRMNLIHMQALVVDKTPQHIPFLYGETYLHIPQLLIPRFLWQDKPHSHISTETLGTRYGITSRTHARSTTIGLGYVAEAWANFGWPGVVGLGILMGSMMRFVANAFVSAHQSSLHSLLSVLWIGHSFAVEACLSQWLSSLLQSAVVLLVVLYPLTYQDDSPVSADDDAGFI